MPKTILAAPDNYVVIDVETTGLDCRSCDIIEFAAVEVSDGEEVARWSSLVKPRELPIDSFIESLTGITSEMLEDAPEIADMMPLFLDFVQDKVVVGHNVTFDARFIDSAARKGGFGAFDPILIDTMRISRRVFPELEHHRLTDVVEKCKEVSAGAGQTPSHRALDDVLATSFCMETMKPLLVDRYALVEGSPFREVRMPRASSGSPRPTDFTITVDSIDEDNPFFGTSMCFTGKLESMTRNEAMQAAVNLGAEPKASYNAKLDYLVVGSTDFCASLKGKPSSKLKKARAAIEKGAPIQIISEDFFLAFVSK